MEDLRTGYYERTNDWEEDDTSHASYRSPMIYERASSGRYTGTAQKEEKSLEEKFALYKVQNIIAVVAVLLLIIMDLFHIQVGDISTDVIFTELSYSFTAQELFQQLTQLPQHLFSSPAP